MAISCKAASTVSRALTSTRSRNKLDEILDSLLRAARASTDPAHEPCSIRETTAAVALRLRQQEESPLVTGTPFTVEGALQESEQARVVTDLQGRIVYANKAWEELCGYRLQEVAGTLGLKFLQGPLTDSNKVRKINESVKENKRVRVMITNYRKDGVPFMNQVQVSPLLGCGGRVTHLLGILNKMN